MLESVGMSRIGREEVERFARLARLRLEASEAEALTRDLEAILGHVAELEALSTEGVPPTACVHPVATPLRPDTPRPSLPPEEALRNAPARLGTAFAVPRVLEDEEV